MFMDAIVEKLFKSPRITGESSLFPRKCRFWKINELTVCESDDTTCSSSLNENTISCVLNVTSALNYGSERIGKRVQIPRGSAAVTSYEHFISHCISVR
jgi:hypothetical protein